MRFFKVKAGKHSVRLSNGKIKTFKTGEIVQSTDDLCKRFVEKFEEIQEPVSAAKTALELAKQRREEVLKKAKEEEDDLPPEPDHVVDETEEEDTSALEGLGDDVSSKFPLFAAADVQVFYSKETKSYTPIKDNEPCGGPFETKDDLKEWFKKWKKANK